MRQPNLQNNCYFAKIIIFSTFDEMEKVLKITQLKDENIDFQYWKSKTEVVRLEALEFLRQQYINFHKDVQPRLQRVYRITNNKQG